MYTIITNILESWPCDLFIFENSLIFSYLYSKIDEQLYYVWLRLIATRWMDCQWKATVQRKHPTSGRKEFFLTIQQCILWYISYIKRTSRLVETKCAYNTYILQGRNFSLSKKNFFVIWSQFVNKPSCEQKLYFIL